MHHVSTSPAFQQAGPPGSPARRWSRALLPAAVLGALVWFAPAESEAAPRCTSKPAVCARLANEKRARATTPAPAAPVAVAVARNEKPRCTTKPTVCARLDAIGARRPSPPVTLAQNSAAGPRCTTKPAVCARLRMRPEAPPMTFANTGNSTND